MRCLVCGFTATPGAHGHKTRFCPLRKTECRRLVASQSPFFLSGPCLNVYCSHAKQCVKCGLVGHMPFTLKLTLRRWRLSPYGISVPCVAHGVPLVGDDFFCSLVTDSDVVLLVASMHDNAPDE